MKTFFSLLNSLIKVLIKTEDFKKSTLKEKKPTQYSNFSHKENIYQKEKNIPSYSYSMRNIYTLNSPNLSAKKLFNELIISGSNYEKLLPTVIKNQIRIEEIEKYIQLNKRRYLEKISIVYGSNFNLSVISLKQKLELLKGFRPSQFKTDSCYLNFFTAEKREDMIFVLEFNLELLQKYHWIIDDLGGDDFFENNWYKLKYYTNETISFLPNYFYSNKLFKIFEIRGFIGFLLFPPIEIAINNLPFRLVKEKFLILNIKIKSRENAVQEAKKMLLETWGVFDKNDMNMLNGKFYYTSKDFYLVKNEFDSVLRFWKYILYTL